MDVIADLVALIREKAGRSPRALPFDMHRLGLYEAEVKACASDGTTLDVTFVAGQLQALDPIQGLRVKVGVPGLVAVMQPGALVLVGWMGGDPSRPYAVPHWSMGATVSKLVLAGSTVYLGAEAGAQFVALANLVKGELDKIATTFGSFVPGTGGASFGTPYTTAGEVAAEKVKAK